LLSSRKIHKVVGLILVLPMLGWTLTGLIFFIKPGYQGAYEQLAVKTYPLNAQLTVHPEQQWEEARLVKTILGLHLLVKVDGKVSHLDPISLTDKGAPNSTQIKMLIEDAISVNKDRYGEVITIDKHQATTNTGVEIKLNWLNLRLSQKGSDTALINLMYKIHYLQWTPYKGFNQVLGVFGLLLLISLTALGIRLYVKNKA